LATRPPRFRPTAPKPAPKPLQVALQDRAHSAGWVDQGPERRAADLLELGTKPQSLQVDGPQLALESGDSLAG
jgi:hypothetical protein